MERYSFLKNWALPVTINGYVKGMRKKKKNSFSNAENDDGSWVWYPFDVTSAGFQPQLKNLTYTREFGCNETVFGG